MCSFWYFFRSDLVVGENFVHRLTQNYLHRDQRLGAEPFQIFVLLACQKARNLFVVNSSHGRPPK